MTLLLAGQTFTDQLIHAFCWTLIHSLWEGMLLALLAGIVVLLTRRSAPVVRYRLLSGLFGVFVAAAVATFAWLWQGGSESSDPLQQVFTTKTNAGGTNIVIDNAGAGSAEAARQIVYNNVNTGIPNRSGLSTPLHDNSTTRIPRSIAGIGNSTPTNILFNRIATFCNNHAYLLVMIWFVLFSMRCLKIALNIGYTQRMRNTGVHEPSEYWKERIKELADRLDIKKKVALLESEIAKVPMMAGFFKPVILIPIGLLAQLPADQVEAVLLHELAHIRRKDYLVNILQHFAEIIFFFNPGVLWLSSMLRDEREHCCDDMAIGETKNKQQFIHALVSFQEYQLSGSSYAVGFPGSRKGQLLQRVKRIVYNDNKSLDIREKIFLLACLFITGALTLAFSQSGKGSPVEKLAKASSGSSRKRTDTLPGTGLRSFSETKRGIKRDGSVVTYYSGGYEIVTMDSTLRELYYRGERIPNERVTDYIDIVNQIILEENRKQLQAVVPIGSKMTQQEWDRRQSEEDVQAATRDLELANRNIRTANLEKEKMDLEKEKADQDRIQAMLDKAKADEERINEGEAPEPPVPTADVVSPIPSVSSPRVPLPKPPSAVLSAPGPGSEDYFQNGRDTLPEAENRRLQQLRDYEKRLHQQQLELNRQQQRLNEQYARLQKETARLTKEDNIELYYNPDSLRSPLFQPREGVQLIAPKFPGAAPIAPKFANVHFAKPIINHNPVADYLIKDLLAEKIITDTTVLSFKLTTDVFVVNRTPLSEEVHARYSKKYLAKSDSHIIYSRSGKGIATEMHNIDSEAVKREHNQ